MQSWSTLLAPGRVASYLEPEKLPTRRNRVADLIDDFAPLPELSSFRHFEETTRQIIGSLLASEEAVPSE
jgi:hypothetical protein